MVAKRGAGGGADKPAKGSWGGARQGAGRKTEDGAMVTGRFTLTLDQETIDVLMDVGESNMSLGVRRLALSYSGNYADARPGAQINTPTHGNSAAAVAAALKAKHARVR